MQGLRQCVSIPRLGAECVVLSPSRRHWLAVFALIAFLFAQSAALLHELGHAASGPDQQLPAGERTSLCKECVYLTDVRHREAVYRTMGEYISGVHPVSTGVVVTALARPSWLVEIDGTAVIPDDEA